MGKSQSVSRNFNSKPATNREVSQYTKGRMSLGVGVTCEDLRLYLEGFMLLLLVVWRYAAVEVGVTIAEEALVLITGDVINDCCCAKLLPEKTTKCNEMKQDPSVSKFRLVVVLTVIKKVV